MQPFVRRPLLASHLILFASSLPSIRVDSFLIFSTMSKHSPSKSSTPRKAKQAKLSSSPVSSAANNNNKKQPYKIYCDLDGVLVDFDAGFRNISGRSPDELNLGHMWSIIAGADSFYEHLPWTPDGRELWNALLPFNPDILTGVPRQYKARREKATWCQRELGVETNHVDMAGHQRSHEIVGGERKEGVVNVITCWSKNKHKESGFHSVLIDDRESLARDWEMCGGVFIHHTSTERTLQQLRDRGILTTKEEDDKVVAEERQQAPREQKSAACWMYDDEPPDTP